MAIMKCSCKNDFQDKEHGKGERVFNETTKGFRCTVCQKDITPTGGKKGYA